MKKTVLILCHSHLSAAPRFLQTVDALKKEYNLIAAGYSSDATSDYQFVKLEKIKKLAPLDLNFHTNYPVVFRKFISFFIRIFFSKRIKLKENYFEFQAREDYKKLHHLNFNLIIAHHIYALPLADLLSSSKECKVILNAHEYYPAQFEDNPKWVKDYRKLNVELCEKYFPIVAKMFTVGENIRLKYLNEFQKNSIVISNSKPFHSHSPKATATQEIKIIHHGAALRARRIETLVEMMNLTDTRFTLSLMLTESDNGYLQELKELAETNSKIKFIEPVKTQEIIPFLNSDFDIGCYILEPNNFNLANSLPNKFFEFVQARLVIAIGPSAEMARYVNKYNLGIVAADFSPKAMADSLNKLSTTQIDSFKQQVDKTAYELRSAKNEKLILQTVNELLN